MTALTNTRLPCIARRVFLLGSGSLIGLGCTPQFFENGSPLVRAESIDVHCHIFNASDVPVRGFVQHVVLNDEEEQRRPLPDPIGNQAILPAFAALIIALLSSGAITADDEFARLSIAAADAAPPLPATSFDRTLANELADILDTPGEAAGEIGSSRQQLRALILSDAGLPPEAEPPDAQEISEALLLSDSMTGRYFRWARLMLSSRTEILDELERLYAGPSGTVLFTPALVDFSLWLDGEPRSSLVSQIVLMDALQRRSTVPIHAFVPFDPWRMARDSATGKPNYPEWQATGGTDPAELSALGLIQWAVEDMGFVGVKLYPPMGFRPSGNAQTDQTYPRRAIEEFPGDFPTRIDSALDALYRWCAQSSVPIMAHASDSQGAAAGYAGRANPAHWAPVLTAHPKLRLNLAHFGDSLTADRDDDTWDDAFGALVVAGHTGAYADLGYYAEVLPRVGGTDLSAQGIALRRFFDRYDPSARRLLFGTDWSMIGREPGHEQFPNRVAALLEAAGLDAAAKRRVFRQNALDFLGLRNGAPGHERLRRYYDRTDRDFSWMGALEAV